MTAPTLAFQDQAQGDKTEDKDKMSGDKMEGMDKMSKKKGSCTCITRNTGCPRRRWAIRWTSRRIRRSFPRAALSSGVDFHAGVFFAFRPEDAS
jgi:hypothetical protein